MTVSDLIFRTLTRIQYARAGDTVSGDDQNYVFACLNGMVDQWAVERLTIPFTQRTTFTITSSKGIIGNPYTVGSGGDVNITAPSLPNSLVIRYQDTTVSPTLEQDLTPLSDDAWIAVPQKNLTSPLPNAYYYQPTYAGGLAALYLWMVPTQAGLQGVVYSPAQLAQFNDPTDTLTVPAGYQMALIDNLAVVVAPDFGQPVTAEMIQRANNSKERIKSTNLPIMDLSVDPALVPMTSGQYSIYADGPV